ncbi:DUF2202 domain-containing protein [Olleya sp. R77988]|uniref:DUF2202 domain-containing protein n=1 Tax=Olleya sp. R77988 TaxID=3093875 RepID=UPI0037C8CC3D
MSFTLLNACSDDNEEDNNDTISQTLTEADKNALLFMLEEEKLARDTYQYLDDLWAINQFSNIKLSEQTHMNLVSNLLDYYNVEYNILPVGEFVNQELQNFYNQFVIDGQVNQSNALQIGATIEDLDIVDLESNLNATTNTSIIEVFENLQCGSRNHLRSFVSVIENSGETYTPQFLTQQEYNLIINSNHEQCN